MNPDEAEKLVDAALMTLREHFEAAQILVTWTENGKCYSTNRGSGNWYARQGLAHEFIARDRAQEIGREISEQMPKPPPDDSEEWKNA
jgi:hypothetical protein